MENMNMKALTLLVILALVLLVAGCGVKTGTYRPAAPVQPQAIPGVAGDVSQDVAGIASLEEELGFEDLEGLDQDLDLGL